MCVLFGWLGLPRRLACMHATLMHATLCVFGACLRVCLAGEVSGVVGTPSAGQQAGSGMGPPFLLAILGIVLVVPCLFSPVRGVGDPSLSLLSHNHDFCRTEYNARRRCCCVC